MAFMLYVLNYELLSLNDGLFSLCSLSGITGDKMVACEFTVDLKKPLVFQVISLSELVICFHEKLLWVSKWNLYFCFDWYPWNLNGWEIHENIGAGSENFPKSMAAIIAVKQRSYTWIFEGYHSV